MFVISCLVAPAVEQEEWEAGSWILDAIRSSHLFPLGGGPTGLVTFLVRRISPFVSVQLI